MRLSQAVEEYIAHKRSLGRGFRSETARLRAFIAAVGDQRLSRLQPEPVRRFLDGTGPVTMFWFSKYHTLNAFFRWATARRHIPKSPLPLTLPQKPERFQPYIYTNDDMKRLIDAADSRHRYVWFLEPDTVRTLLLLLYGTGLRIGEALRLNLGEFDIAEGVLTIRETKFFKSRLCSGRIRFASDPSHLYQPAVAARAQKRIRPASRNTEIRTHQKTDRRTGF